MQDAIVYVPCYLWFTQKQIPNQRTIEYPSGLDNILGI